jgi:hypothetical protein
MGEISIPRILRIAVALSAAGAVIVGIALGSRNALGFLAGALLACLTVQAWGRLAASLGNPAGTRGAMGSSVFLAVRYILIAAALYVTMKVLGSSPVAAILGLLVSFAAVLVEVVFSTFSGQTGAKQ